MERESGRPAHLMKPAGLDVNYGASVGSLDRHQHREQAKGGRETHQSVTNPSSSPSNFFISSSEISNPPTSAFATRRSARALLGSVTKPCWIDHLVLTVNTPSPPRFSGGYLPHQHLRLGTPVPRTHLLQNRMSEPHPPRQRGIRLQQDPVALAGLADGKLRVERVDLDLVDRGERQPELWRGATAVVRFDKGDKLVEVPDAKVAHAYGADLAGGNEGGEGAVGGLGGLVEGIGGRGGRAKGGMT